MPFLQLYPMSLITKMSFFENGLRTTVMTTELLIESNVSKKTLFECLDIAKKFEQKYSAYDEGSLLSQINKASGIKSIRCEYKELEIFQKALELARMSNGSFDPTIGVLTQGLYGFGTKNEKIPTSIELLKTRKLVNYKYLHIHNNEIFLTHTGMKLDLGGIGKGYVADKIMEHLQRMGATKAIVSVGGEVCSFGKKYNIAIKNPFKDGNIGLIKTSKEALCISTSGDYERFIKSKEHHHILDKESAKPNHYYSSVTIIKNGMDTTTLDGIATVVFNSNRSKLKEMAQRFNVAVVAISRDKEILFENFSDINIESFEVYPF
ncbi:FAD:protein FMN transferase [bacterium]|nr:FAD:protein FMN transferase [bacterium]MBU1989762.1 FAD:protein FMN transferase [bacterium]